jgi:preprotein translocase subunit SecY
MKMIILLVSAIALVTGACMSMYSMAALLSVVPDTTLAFDVSAFILLVGGGGISIFMAEQLDKR